MRLEACAAVDGAVVSGKERNLGGCTALCTNCFVHFSFAAIVALTLALVSARLAANGLVFEALLKVKFLLTCCEREFCATVFTNECFVFKHFGKIPLVKFLVTAISADLVFAPTLAV